MVGIIKTIIITTIMIITTIRITTIITVITVTIFTARGRPGWGLVLLEFGLVRGAV